MNELTYKREDIERLQGVMSRMPQIELETRHYFSQGLYCREILIPKDCTLVGKVHKHEHLCMLTKGFMTIISGDGRQTLQAPCVFVSRPGVKRAGYAHEDSVFVTVHNTDIKDLAQIEAELVEPDETALFDERNKLKAIA